MIFLCIQSALYLGSYIQQTALGDSRGKEEENSSALLVPTCQLNRVIAREVEPLIFFKGSMVPRIPWDWTWNQGFSASLPREKGFRQFEWASQMVVFLKPSLSLSHLPNKCLMGVLNSYFYLGESAYFHFKHVKGSKERQADTKTGKTAWAKHLRCKCHKCIDWAYYSARSLHWKVEKLNSNPRPVTK